MKEIKDILKEQPFFSELKESEIDLIAGCGKIVHFQPNQMIAREGDDSNEFFLIRKGKVGIEINHPSQGPMVIQTVTPGQISGFSWIFPPYKYWFDMESKEHTSAIAFDGKCIRGKLDNDTDLGYRLMKLFAKVMTERLKNTRLQLLDVYAIR